MKSPQHRSDPYAALRIKNYRRFALGFLTSNLGEQMASVAVGWEIYDRTGSAAALGFVGLVEALPVLALSLVAGHVTDQYSRKRILVLTLLAPVLCYSGLAWASASQAPVSVIYAFLFLAAVARAFRSPARSALVPQLVPLPLLGSAITWNSTSFEIAAMAGPMLGGFLIAGFKSYTLVYGLNAFGNLAFCALAATLEERSSASRARQKLSWESLWAGVRFIRNTPLILSTITLDLFAVLLGGATALLPMFAKDILHTTPAGLGWLRAAPAIGAFTMAILQAHLPPRYSALHNAGRALLWAVTGFGLATIVFGLSKSFWLSMTMLVLTGAFDNISVVIRTTLVSMLTPDEMRGRVNAVNYVFIGASNQIGAFESGIAAAAFGPLIAVVGGGIGTIITVLAVMRMWPELRLVKSIENP